jgi:phosphatidylserine decarboxylase
MNAPHRVTDDHADRPASLLARIFLQEDLNFLLTNRLPRALVTQAAGRLFQLRSRTFTRLGLKVWGLFADDLRLYEARDRSFESLHDAFIRALKPGARPIHPDPDLVVSPCDAVVGALGAIDGLTVHQIKDSPYRLDELTLDPALAARYAGGTYVTLRLKSNFYHRLHAPCAGRLTSVRYISGDTWNVNPITLRRVERLFCKNERAVLDLELPDGGRGITLVPVAAILVASIHLHALGRTLDLRHRGPNVLPCDANFQKGEELGYFHAGSTVVVLADARFRLATNVQTDHVLRVGEPLFYAPPGVLT